MASLDLQSESRDTPRKYKKKHASIMHVYVDEQIMSLQIMSLRAIISNQNKSMEDRKEECCWIYHKQE